MAKYIRINSDHPDSKVIGEIAKALKNGAVIIYPTDTVYGVGCDINNAKAIERVAQIKGTKAKKSNLSIVCHNLSHLSLFVKPIPNSVFRVLKKSLPGAFTFILPANNNVPKVFNTKKKEVGIRVPNHHIPRAIVEALGNPIVTTSVIDLDELVEYTMDPEMIFQRFQDKVDIVIDGGYGNNIPSTIVLVENESFEVIREGLGEFSQ
ncbi:MAG: tRNA threonylcarbamoyl adenosine modification protein (Sua5/YciO/YrdC/YwlC family) [Salibacteraceae bacterium]|jgi:tRNA threonylcarbamoyl adenosine modification protein (Sua5/YciO/YrdC/YwlC family)